MSVPFFHSVAVRPCLQAKYSYNK